MTSVSQTSSATWSEDSVSGAEAILTAEKMVKYVTARMDLTVILEEKLVREIAPNLKTIGVEEIVEYSINKIIH